MKSFDKLAALVSQAAVEASKVDGGNKSAGTRLRGLMQEVKAAAQEVRLEVLNK